MSDRPADEPADGIEAGLQRLLDRRGLVRQRRDPAQKLDVGELLLKLQSALPDALLQRVARRFQSAIAQLDLAEHVVEAVDEEADLVAAAPGRPHRIISLGGHRGSNKEKVE